MKQHGPWTIHQSDEIYRDPWVRLQVDKVTRPDGKPGSYCTVNLKAGVCVVAVGEGDQVFLTREFHYAVGRTTIEGVSGGIEEGEDPFTAAQRELREEIGIEADHWTTYPATDPFTAAVLSPTILYVARGLRFVPPENEGTELIERVDMSLEQALNAVDSGEITHAPTCIILLRLALEKFRRPNNAQ